jgi:F420-dependent oxidoreductase-like protein
VPAPELKASLQIPRFTYDGLAPEDLFERVAATAVAAEDSGFDAVFVMDHFWQLPMMGPPDWDMFDGYTILAALAARTSRVKLGTLVTGVTYRNPAHLAKIVTNLDVISRGRALLGIGAAWFEEEHRAYDFDFPPVRERFERLEDALHICKAMFTEHAPSYSGRHHSIEGAFNVPRPVTPGGPPILIGGGGERRTLRLTAEHADAWNVPCTKDELPGKLEVLARHCADVGRDPATITKTWLGSLVVAPTHDEAYGKLSGMLAGRGFDESALDDPGVRSFVLGRFVVGDPDEVGEQVAELRAGGLDGVVLNMPVDGFDTEAVSLAGAALSKVG